MSRISPETLRYKLLEIFTIFTTDGRTFKGNHNQHGIVQPLLSEQKVKQEGHCGTLHLKITLLGCKKRKESNYFILQVCNHHSVQNVNCHYCRL